MRGALWGPRQSSMRIYAVPLEHGVALRGELNMALPHGGLRGFVRLRAALRQ